MDRPDGSSEQDQRAKEKWYVAVGTAQTPAPAPGCHEPMTGMTGEST
jgi:hypothetical protein